MDNTLSLNGSVLNQIPGVIDKAIHITDGGGTLSHFWDRCFNYDCFPKYTLSFWLKYKRISFNQQYLLSFSDRFVIYQDYSEPKDYLTVQSRVAFSRCNFKVFIPAEVWAHLIFVVKDENFTVYLNGQKVDNTTLDCSEFASGPGWDIYLRLGDYYLYGYGYGPKDFSLDDVRLLFDSMSAEDTLDNYKTITGMIISDGGLYKSSFCFFLLYNLLKKKLSSKVQKFQLNLKLYKTQGIMGIYTHRANCIYTIYPKWANYKVSQFT